MALIDAVANSIDVPLWRLFGGVSNTLSTAATVKSQIKAYILQCHECLTMRGFSQLISFMVEMETLSY